MSLEMAHKVILPPKKNYIPQFLKQRDINSYYKTSHGFYQELSLHLQLLCCCWCFLDCYQQQDRQQQQEL
jgi:hypothetical protein